MVLISESIILKVFTVKSVSFSRIFRYDFIAKENIGIGKFEGHG